MWLWITAPVWAASGPVLEVFTNAQGVRAPLLAEIGGESVELHDDGIAPDRAANDGYWSGTFSRPGQVGFQQPLQVRDAGGTTWSGGVEWSGPSPSSALVGLENGGTILKPPFPAPRAVPSLREAGGEGAGSGSEPTSSPGSGGSAQPAWLLAALGWGLFIATALRQVRLRPISIPGQSPPHRSGRYVIRADAEARVHLLTWMTRHYRVILIGEIRAVAVPSGAVFLPRTPDLGDVSALVEVLSGLGLPLAVLISEEIRGAEALAEGLSGDLPVFWVRADQGAWSVAADGTPCPPA